MLPGVNRKHTYDFSDSDATSGAALAESEKQSVSAADKICQRGVLALYADPALMKKEEGAWERAVTEKCRSYDDQ